MLAHASPSLNVVVLPFAPNTKASSALEKELDRVKGVTLKASEEMQSALKAAGSSASEPNVIGGIMRAHGVDVLVRGEKAKSGVLKVDVLASDGSTRFGEEVALKGTPKDIAKRIASALKPVLSSWKQPSADAPTPPPATHTPTATATATTPPPT